MNSSTDIKGFYETKRDPAVIHTYGAYSRFLPCLFSRGES
jgi:hypothetical protein